MEGFVPSYSNEEERLKIRKEKDRKLRIRQTIIIVVASVVVVTLITLGYILSTRKYNLYKEYEKKMDIYGFSKVYDDGDADTSNKVTKSEALKMVLSCVYNVSDIEGIALPTQETYPNAIWVEYAKKQGIVGKEEITAKNADDKASYSEVLVWFYNVKTNILRQTPDTNQENIHVKDINAYNPDQQLAIYDLINSNVIVKNPTYLRGNEKLYKGKLNELIINFAEKYNTITVSGARLNINPEKIPDNMDKYPYSLAAVQKEIYELPFKNDGAQGFIYPIDYYKDNKEFYGQIKTYIELYYGYLLNVDYQKITVEDMKKVLNKYSLEKIDDSKIEAYVKYVKDKKIKLTGTVTVQMPCVYFDGTDYRVRTKLEFKVESADTRDNLLFEDLGDLKTSYTGKEFEEYVDVLMAKNDVSQTLFIQERAIHSMLAKPSSVIVSLGD